jgi:hypothetical protein
MSHPSTSKKYLADELQIVKKISTFATCLDKKYELFTQNRQNIIF